MAEFSRTTTLKTYSDLETQLKFAAQSLEVVKARFIAAQKAGVNKPQEYSADEEYTQLFKLGPVVTDLVDAVKKLEDEMVNLNKYIEEQLGRNPDEAILPPTINIDGKASIYAASNGDVTFTSLV